MSTGSAVFLDELCMLPDNGQDFLIAPHSCAAVRFCKVYTFCSVDAFW